MLIIAQIRKESQLQENIMLLPQQKFETEEERERRYEYEQEQADRAYEDRIFDEIAKEKK